MIRGLYTAATAMQAQQTAQDLIAQNLANVSTPGYRRQVAATHAFSTLVGQSLTGSTPGNRTAESPPAITEVLSAGDPAQGAIRATGNATDLALNGDGFFVIQAPNGQETYTRDGAFTLDANNHLVTADGNSVLGEHGPITITSADWAIDQSGQVKCHGAIVDRLRLVSLPNFQAATRLGNNQWRASRTAPAARTQVLQGHLEGSNVNAVTEMVGMITAVRQFEANQRCIQALDSTLDHAVNDVGRA